MTNNELSARIKKYLFESYPNIVIKTKPWDEDPSRLAIYFIEEAFKDLYPMQRYHYIIHKIPEDFFHKYLSNSVWFELAPDETIDDLEYPNDEFINSISDDVMKVLYESNYFTELDNIMAPQDVNLVAQSCNGDFRITKSILKKLGFVENGKINEVFDICHVLMSKGGYCDCEVLTNVAEGTNYNKIIMSQLIEQIESNDIP